MYATSAVLEKTPRQPCGLHTRQIAMANIPANI
jgi:hypothetical protein